MEFDDYKIEPNVYQEMAKAYFSNLAENDFKFVKINTNKKQKQEILDKISKNICKLNIYIECLKKTSKAHKHPQNIEKIKNNFQVCKKLFDCKKNTEIYQKNNLCSILKNITEICADLILLCDLFDNFSQTDADDQICKLTPNFVEIIKNTVSLFGECRYRY